MSNTDAEMVMSDLTVRVRSFCTPHRHRHSGMIRISGSLQLYFNKSGPERILYHRNFGEICGWVPIEGSKGWAFEWSRVDLAKLSEILTELRTDMVLDDLASL